jgi:WD40 repeat protein
MTPSSDHSDLEQRLTVMLSERAAALKIEGDVDAVIAQALTVGERRSRGSWVLVAVAAASVIVVSLGLLTLGALREQDDVQLDSVPPTTVESTVAPTVTEPLGASPPDGLVIVAANPEGGGGRNGDLFMLVPGEAPRMIVGAAEDGIAQQCPQLSVDGRLIAWGEGAATGTPGSQRGVWPVVDRAVVVAPIRSDGTVADPIVRVPVPDGSGEMTCPRWAPDGSAVAYRVDGDVWITDSADGTTTVVDAAPLRGPGDDPSVRWSLAEVAWSNDSARIMASELGQVRIIDVASGATSVRDTGDLAPRNLMWLPTDQTFIYSTTDEPGDINDIVVAPVDGTDSGESILRSLPEPGVNASSYLRSPVLSPDGNRVAVLESTTTCEGGGCSQGTTQIQVIDLATFSLAPTPLPDEWVASTVRWSPDGRRLLLSSISGVVSVPVDGQGPTVTFAVGDEIDLEWSYDEITWRMPS